MEALSYSWLCLLYHAADSRNILSRPGCCRESKCPGRKQKRKGKSARARVGEVLPSHCLKNSRHLTVRCGCCHPSWMWQPWRGSSQRLKCPPKGRAISTGLNPSQKSGRATHRPQSQFSRGRIQQRRISNNNHAGSARMRGVEIIVALSVCFSTTNRVLLPRTSNLPFTSIVAVESSAIGFRWMARPRASLRAFCREIGY